jgi:hypothetical protein
MTQRQRLHFVRKPADNSQVRAGTGVDGFNKRKTGEQ